MGDNEGFVFRWTLDDFCQLNGKPVFSPVFAADVPHLSYWRLELYSRWKNNDPFVACYLEYHKSNKYPEAHVGFQISIIDVNGVQRASRGSNGVFEHSRGLGFAKFIQKVELKLNASQLLPRGQLTIECRLKPLPQFGDDADLHRLSRVFLGLFSSPIFSDLVLKSENQEFHVHREVIQARSPAFYRTHARKTTRTARIMKIPPAVLKEFLMYLYCGILKTNSPEVVDRLYEMSERYGVFDLRRVIAPTPSESSARCRRLYNTQSVIFPIKNFQDVTRCSMGRLVNLGFARVGVEYFVDETSPEEPQVGIEIRSFLTDPDSTDTVLCTVSVRDVEQRDFHISPHEVALNDSVAVLHTNILKKHLLNSKFLMGGETLYIRITFSVLTAREPIKIASSKTRRGLSMGQYPPSIPTLKVLSIDLGQLAENSQLPSLHPSTMEKYLTGMQKAVFSAWSWVFHDLLINRRNPTSVPRLPIDPESCNLLYYYMCTGRVTNLFSETFFNMYPVATMYELPSLRDLIVRIVKSKLSEGNAIQSLMFAHAFNIEELLVYVKGFISKNPDGISHQDSWKHLCDVNPTLVETILGSVEDLCKLTLD